MKRLLDNTTIRSQIMIALLLVGLIPLVLVTLQSLHCAHEGIVEVQRRQLSRLLHVQQSGLAGWTRERANLLRLVGSCAAMEELMSDDESVAARQDMISYLEDVQGLSPSIEAIAVFDTDWELLAKGRSHRHAAADLLSPDLLERLPTAEDVSWARDLHRHQDGLVAGLAGLPLRSEGNQTRGYLVAAIELDQAIQDLHRTSPADEGLRTYLVDVPEQRYISVPLAMHGQLGEPAVIGEPHHGHHGGLLMYDDFTGKPVIAMAADLPELPWRLVVELDRDQAFGLVDFLLRRATYMAVFIAIVLLAIALPVARLLSRPLQELRDTCQQIAAGASGQRVDSLNGREAKEVAASFNAMMDQLQDTQRQLVQAGALAAVGELSASIVHEMRNPLNTIHLNLQAMRRKVAAEPKYLELYELAERQTKRLQDMLNSLLSFGKPLDLHRLPHDLREVIGDVQLALHQQAERHGIAIGEELPRLPVMAWVDREQLYRVLANLVENAIQAQAETGGRIGILLHSVPGAATIEISDRGTGIPDGMRDKIFRPFFTNRPGGTGLGLAIARKIVELHHGTLAVSATGPQGTTFTIRLPLNQGELHEPPADHR